MHANFPVSCLMASHNNKACASHGIVRVY